MKTMKTKLLFILLFVSSMITAQDNLKTLTEGNYTINYPQDWIIESNKQSTAEFLLMADPKSAQKDQFNENINLTLEKLPKQKVELDYYIKVSIENIKSQVPSSKILLSETRRSENGTYQEVIWTGNFGELGLKFKQYIMVRGSTAYILTFTASIAEYIQYETTGDLILNSFKVN